VEVVGCVGEDVVVKGVREVVVEVEFESDAFALRRNRHEEVIDAVWGRNRWGAGDFCNVGKETVETLENLGGGVGGDVK
jgi:hypothetical protein